MFPTFILLRKGDWWWLEVNSHQALQLGYEDTCCWFPGSRTPSRLGACPRSPYSDEGRREEISSVAASPHLQPIFSRPPAFWEMSPNTWGQDSLLAYRASLKEWSEVLNGTKYFPWGDWEICRAMAGGEQRIWAKAESYAVCIRRCYITTSLRKAVSLSYIRFRPLQLLFHTESLTWKEGRQVR